MDDNQDGGGAKATETPPISVSEVTTDHSGAPLGTTPSSDVTGSGHPMTGDQVAQQPAIPPQGESFTQIGVSSGGQPQLDQAHSNLHHVDSQRYGVVMPRPLFDYRESTFCVLVGRGAAPLRLDSVLAD